MPTLSTSSSKDQVVRACLFLPWMIPVGAPAIGPAGGYIPFSSRTPPRLMRTNSRPNARAMDFPAGLADARRTDRDRESGPFIFLELSHGEIIR